jgi:hypothetical protein
VPELPRDSLKSPGIYLLALRGGTNPDEPGAIICAPAEVLEFKGGTTAGEENRLLFGYSCPRDTIELKVLADGDSIALNMGGVTNVDTYLCKIFIRASVFDTCDSTEDYINTLD